MSDLGPTPAPTPPLGTSVLDDGGGPGPAQVLRWVRTVVAGCLGIAAAAFLAASLVVAMSVHEAFDEEHPWAFMGLLLGVPEVRAELAPDLVDDVAEVSPSAFSPGERAEAERAVDDVLASPVLREAFRDLTVVDGRVDGTAFVAVVVGALDERARDTSPDVRAALEAYAAGIGTASEREGAIAEVTDSSEAIGELRRIGFAVAAVVLVPGLVCWALAVLVARRRGLAAALVLSGGLLLASALLAPGRAVLDLLPGPLEVPGAVLATLGSMVGAGWVWSLVVWALVPPAVWGTVRVVRRSRTRDEGAGHLWVP